MNRLLAFLLLFPAGLVVHAQETEVTLEPLSGLQLHGTLRTGLGPRAATAILLLPGSGPTNRDGNSMGGNTPSTLFKLATALSDSGFTTLRIDKRFIGKSRPDSTTALTMEGHRFRHWVEDAARWAEWLHTQPGVERVVIAGHSQGSLVALLAAGESEKVDGVISLCGAGRPIAQVIKDQMKPQLPTPLFEKLAAKMDSLENGQEVVDSPPLLRALLNKPLQPFLMSWMAEDPCRAVASCQVPVLVVQGGKDLQVKEEEGQLLKSCNERVSYVLIEDLNHPLYAIRGDFNENLGSYSDPKRTLHPQVVKEMIRYLNDL